MADLAIVASGSRGDVQPYVALGSELKTSGHVVTVLTNENYKSLVEGAGLHFISTGPSVQDVLQSEEWKGKTENRNFLKILADGQKYMKELAAAQAKSLPHLLKGRDLIIGGVAGLFGSLAVADSLGIPFIQAYVFPFTATREFPSPLVPRLPSRKLLNRLSFDITRQLFWQVLKENDRITRQILGLPKGSFWGPFRELNRRDEPVLYGYSRHALPRPNDWAANHHVTGYWYLDAPLEWEPPSDLVQFLEAGSRPVYIGFGSMVSRDPEKTSEIIIEALSLAGQRGILSSGWGGLNPSNLPETVHLVSSLPHAWLLPHVATVVHHGGAGTTAAGLEAGVPAIIVPHGGDQAFWGKRLVDLGVAAASIPKKKLNAKTLAIAIRTAVDSEVMHERAKRLAQQIREETREKNASRIINRYLEARGIGVRQSSPNKAGAR